jgi:DNA-binding CsgD family transcriptional regulator
MPYSSQWRLEERADRFRAVQAEAESLTDLLAKTEMVYLRASLRQLPAARRKDIAAACAYSAEEAKAARSRWSKNNMRKAMAAMAARRAQNPEEDRRIRSAAGKLAWRNRTELGRKRHLSILQAANEKRAAAHKEGREAVVKAYLAGDLSVAEIASEYNLHEMTVYRILRAAKVPRRIARKAHAE